MLLTCHSSDHTSTDHSSDEAKGKIQETTIHLWIENQGDKMNCENGATEGTYLVEKVRLGTLTPSLTYHIILKCLSIGNQPYFSKESSALDLEIGEHNMNAEA